MHFSSAGRGKTLTKRAKRLSGWEDTSRKSGFAYPEDDSSDDNGSGDPDDPGYIAPKPTPKDLQKIKANDYILYRFKVRFLYYYSYMNTRYLFLLNLKFVYDIVKMYNM